MVNKKMYYYAGYDMLHRETKIKNFYWDTRENIFNYLKSIAEFHPGTTEEEINEHINLMFETYTK